MRKFLLALVLSAAPLLFAQTNTIPTTAGSYMYTGHDSFTNFTIPGITGCLFENSSGVISGVSCAPPTLAGNVNGAFGANTVNGITIGGTSVPFVTAGSATNQAPLIFSTANGGEIIWGPTYVPSTGGTYSGGINGTTAAFSGQGIFQSLILSGLTAGTSPLCANGTSGAITNVGCTASLITSLSTNNHSGAASISSGQLNIPIYAAQGANSDITSLSGLTTPLSIPQGGLGNTTGQAVTALALSAVGTPCANGLAPTGVDAQGNSVNCQPIGTDGFSYPGIIFATAASAGRLATSTDIVSQLNTVPISTTAFARTLIPVASNTLLGGVICDGTTITCSVGGVISAIGGGGSPAGANGNPQINASGSLGAITNVFYQQSGDTIASIETACSSLCTYVVTSPQTLTLTASHTLNANVQLRFEANGSWTINGATFTLTIPGHVDGTLTQHFPAGTGSVAFGPNQAEANVEWFGAIGDWNGTTGTDNTAAIQACFNTMSSGQCVLQSLAYKTTAALTIYKGQVGLRGVKTGRGVGSEIITTSATADILDVGNGSLQGWNNFNNFTLARSVVPTGTTDAGLSLNHAAGVTIDNVESQDSHRDFYYHQAYSFGVGVTSNSSADFTLSGETSGNWYGFYLDSADGNAENSIRFLHNAASNDTGIYTQNTYGMILNGSALNDVMSKGLETANTTYGVYINYTGGGTSIATSDIHFIDSIIDGIRGTCFYVNGTTAATDGSVEISGGWCNGFNTTGKLIDIESSFGVQVRGLSITQHDIFGATGGIYANGSNGLILTDNNINAIGTGSGGVNPIFLNATTHSTITGNKITTLPGTAGNLIGLAGSSYNTITGNTLAGYSSGYGIFFDATSTNNMGVSANSIDTTNIAGGAIGDAGTNNGMLGPMYVSGAISAGDGNVAGSLPNRADLSYNTAGNYFEMDSFGATTSLVPDFYLIGRNSNETTNDSYLHCTFNTLNCDFGGNSISMTAQGTANSSANVNSPNLTWTAPYWNGTASATDTITCYDNLGVWSSSDTNPTARFECDHAGSPGGWAFYVSDFQTLNANIANLSIYGGNLNLNAVGAATSSTNNNSSTETLQDAYWTGSVGTSSSWTLQALAGTGSNPPQTLKLNRSGAGTGAQLIDFSIEPIKLGATTATTVNATSSVTAPFIAATGSAVIAANQFVLTFGSGIGNLIAFGANPSTVGAAFLTGVSSDQSVVDHYLECIHGISCAFADLVTAPSVVAGYVGINSTIPSTPSAPNEGYIGINSSGYTSIEAVGSNTSSPGTGLIGSTSSDGSVNDLALSWNGSSVDIHGTTITEGSLTFSGLVAGGASQFTASGCSNSTLLGGSTAGSFHSGTSGTCTVTITMGSSQIAPHGWTCSHNDLTTPADTIMQTATTTTTVTLSGTTVTGDVINFGCMGY